MAVGWDPQRHGEPRCSLSEKAPADLRRGVGQAVRGGMRQTEAARVLGVARGSVNRWMAQPARPVRRFGLPPYSPERNPDECLHQTSRPMRWAACDRETSRS